MSNNNTIIPYTNNYPSNPNLSINRPNNIFSKQHKKQQTKETQHTQTVLQQWFSNINPQYFLTIQFPIHQRNTDIVKSNKKLHRVMLDFEKLLLGKHWYRKHIPFIVMAEHGKYSVNWHYHVLIYDCPFDLFKMQDVTQSVLIKLGLPHETLHIESVNDDGVNSYTSKEIIADINYHFDSDRIITSEILFNLQHKSSKPIPDSQKHTPEQQKFNF